MNEGLGHHFTVKYEYYTWHMGCDCCDDYASEIHIYDNRRTDGAYASSFECGLIADEHELREFIHNMDSYYDGFVVHPDTRYF